MTDIGDDMRRIVTALPLMLHPDPMRTVVRPFVPSDPEDYAVAGHPRAERIVARILSLDDAALAEELERVELSLDSRHRDTDPMLRDRFAGIADLVPDAAALSDAQRLLIGAYFSAEYSFEAAALFNPSIVAFPDPAGDHDPAEAAATADDDGSVRFLLSLRGIGEGHMSSVTFRTGLWAADGTLSLDEPSRSALPLRIEAQADDTVILHSAGSRDPSETVLFPVVESQSRGIEDLRLTPLTRADGTRTFAGTYTALGGAGVRQELLFTDDFKSFRMHPVRGALAGGKGMAVFPRPVGGRYLALGRQDAENLWLFRSDDLLSWGDGTKLMGPEYPWEYVQIGNCGAPLEIAEGWLMLTHGVGVVRNYCMGAALLDRDDPSRILARTPRPFLEPSPDDRDGYVPNVVYSCGGLVRGRTLLLPYGIADEYTGFCTIDVDALLAKMV